jgi:hypothetical protein
MKHVKLSENPPYETLCYIRGPADVSTFIEINDSVVHVRENLWLALTHLAFKDSIRCLWIYALCSNQENISERNHQVNLMGMV